MANTDTLRRAAQALLDAYNSYDASAGGVAHALKNLRAALAQEGQVVISREDLGVVLTWAEDHITSGWTDKEWQALLRLRAQLK